MCRKKRIGGGVAIFVRNDIEYDQMYKYSDNSVSFLGLKCKLDNNAISIMAIVPPTKLLNK